MNRKQLLAAETFGYSYVHYREHLEMGHERFERLMPADMDVLERAAQEGWEDARLAQAIGIDKEQVEKLRRAYRRAKAIVDAPTAAESFRRGVRYSIQDAVETGLTGAKEIEKLVVQICYRAADLGELLDREQKRLADYSEDLREEPRLLDVEW
jgi:hypothetical protein